MIVCTHIDALIDIIMDDILVVEEATVALYVIWVISLTMCLPEGREGVVGSIS